MRYVIIGVGAAGMTAAKEIRSRDEDAHITMIAPDEHVHSAVCCTNIFPMKEMRKG